MEFSKKISWSEKLQKLLSLALIAYNLLPDFIWNIISFIYCFYIYESLNFQVHYIYAYSSKRASITTTKLVFQHFYLDTWLSKVKLCLLVSHSVAFLYSWRYVRYSHQNSHGFTQWLRLEGISGGHHVQPLSA